MTTERDVVALISATFTTEKQHAPLSEVEVGLATAYCAIAIRQLESRGLQETLGFTDEMAEAAAMPVCAMLRLLATIKQLEEQARKVTS